MLWSIAILRKYALKHLGVKGHEAGNLLSNCSEKHYIILIIIDIEMYIIYMLYIIFS